MFSYCSEYLTSMKYNLHETMYFRCAFIKYINSIYLLHIINLDLHAYVNLHFLFRMILHIWLHA